jgi:hypothetical protein
MALIGRVYTLIGEKPEQSEKYDAGSLIKLINAWNKGRGIVLPDILMGETDRRGMNFALVTCCLM